MAYELWKESGFEIFTTMLKSLLKFSKMSGIIMDSYLFRNTSIWLNLVGGFSENAFTVDGRPHHDDSSAALK